LGDFLSAAFDPGALSLGWMDFTDENTFKVYLRRLKFGNAINDFDTN
jgi:hypothetical protein